VERKIGGNLISLGEVSPVSTVFGRVAFIYLFICILYYSATACNSNTKLETYQSCNSHSQRVRKNKIKFGETGLFLHVFRK